MYTMYYIDSSRGTGQDRTAVYVWCGLYHVHVPKKTTDTSRHNVGMVSIAG